MTIERIAPIGMIFLSAVSMVVYAYAGDVRRAIYWAAAAVLTAAVTF